MERNRPILDKKNFTYRRLGGRMFKMPINPRSTELQVEVSFDETTASEFGPELREVLEAFHQEPDDNTENVRYSAE